MSYSYHPGINMTLEYELQKQIIKWVKLSDAWVSYEHSDKDLICWFYLKYTSIGELKMFWHIIN